MRILIFATMAALILGTPLAGAADRISPVGQDQTQPGQGQPAPPGGAAQEMPPPGKGQPAPPQAESQPLDVEVLNYGLAQAEVVRKQRQGGQRVTIVRNVRVVQRTLRVPGRLGQRFGLTYRVNGPSPGQLVRLRVKVSSPRYRTPSGREVTGWQYPVRRTPGKVHYEGISFSKPYQIASGFWTIAIYHQGRRLAAKTFLVFRPPVGQMTGGDDNGPL